MTIQVASNDHQSGHNGSLNPSSASSLRWKRGTQFFIGIAFFSAVIYGVIWWSERLTVEEGAYLGHWVAIDSIKRYVPKEETLSTLIRELEFRPDHEVRLKLYTQPTDLMRNAYPRSAIYPLRITGPSVDSGEAAIVPSPHPATLPDSIVNTPAGAEITGRWKITNGQIDIVWDTNQSIYETINRKISPYLVRLLHFFEGTRTGLCERCEPR